MTLETLVLLKYIEPIRLNFLVPYLQQAPQQLFLYLVEFSFFVQTILQTRQFATDVAQLNLYVNGTPDGSTPYVETLLNTPKRTNNTVATIGNTYLVNTFLGSRRPV